MADIGREPSVDPPVVRPPNAFVLWAILLVGGAVAAVVVTLALTSPDLDRPGLRAAVATWAFLPYVVAGVIAWWRRPASGFGPLMVVAGFALAASSLQWSSVPALYTVGVLFDLAPAALFLHVFLAFPSGRLAQLPERALVTVAYVAALGLQVGVLASGGFDPRNLLAVSDRPGIAEAVQDLQLLTLAVAALGGVVVLIARRRARPPTRRATSVLLIDSFALGLVLLAVLLLAGALQLPGFEIVRVITFVVIGLGPIAFLAGLLDVRLARSAVGDLLVEMREDPAGDLRAAMARALRDPSLSLAYWMPRSGSWVDQDGRPVPPPTTSPERSVTLVDRNGEHIAALLHDPSLRQETELLEAVSAAAGLALENGRLQAELRARMQELHGSRARLLEAEQEERRRLERDLHDGAQQRLVSLVLELAVLERRLDREPEARDRVGHAKDELVTSLQELRDLAHGIHPAAVSAHGLPVALESLAHRLPVPVELTVRLDGRLDERVEETAYYVVCEALANVTKHARAAHATVKVVAEGDVLVVEVSDDGVGGAAASDGSGLRGMGDRVDTLGGEMAVASPAGGGTRLRVELPCA
jgi:signal transduction histidine kinase